MRRKFAVTIPIIAGMVCFVALFAEPSVRTGSLLGLGLTASVIVTVHYLNRV